MRKQSTPALIFFLILVSFSCEVDRPARYFEINGKRSSIGLAYMDTQGTSEDLKSRIYAISFRSEEVNPKNFITFLISSYTNETDILAEGTYDYNYLEGRGLVSYLTVGQDLAYDYLGLPTGMRLDDDVAEFSGTITVERDRNNYTFIFDLTCDYDNSVYTITGEYNGSMVLNSWVVNIDDY